MMMERLLDLQYQCFCKVSSVERALTRCTYIHRVVVVIQNHYHYHNKREPDYQCLFQ